MDISSYKVNSGHVRQLDFISKIRTVPNSMIFAGPEGIGKKLVSQFYFAHINSGQVKAAKVLAQHDLDQWHVYAPEEGKKSISVDQIRALVQDVQTNPHPYRYRLVVIDRAETLTFEAASAMLKVLEDPPYDWTRFVLLVNSADHLLPTIRSRSHLLQFYPLAVSEVEAVLSQRQLERAAELARISGGSVGRALELASDQNKQVRSSIVSFITAGTQMVVYTVFQFVDDLKPEDLPIVNKVLETVVCDLIQAKLVGHVRFNKDYEAELIKRASQSPKALEAFLQDINTYLSYSSRGLNAKLQLKTLFLSSLFFAKGLVLSELKK